VADELRRRDAEGSHETIHLLPRRRLGLGPAVGEDGLELDEVPEALHRIEMDPGVPEEEDSAELLHHDLDPENRIKELAGSPAVRDREHFVIGATGAVVVGTEVHDELLSGEQGLPELEPTPRNAVVGVDLAVRSGGASSDGLGRAQGGVEIQKTRLDLDVRPRTVRKAQVRATEQSVAIRSTTRPISLFGVEAPAVTPMTSGPSGSQSVAIASEPAPRG